MATKTLTINVPCNAPKGGCSCASCCKPANPCAYPYNYPYPQAGVCCNSNAQSCGNSCSPCQSCDSVVLMPLNPAILVAPNTHILASAVANNCGQLSVSFDDAVLVNPAALLTAGDFRALCVDDYVRLILLTA